MSQRKANTPTQAEIDLKFMRMAIDEAKRCEPKQKGHPVVAAVVVNKDGSLIDKAFRAEQEDGEHAEFTLLEKKLKHVTLAGATVYTTLEPCTVRGKTRDGEQKIPCADRLIDRKVARVVIGIIDPNKKISGDGYRRLKSAGIKVDFFPDELWDEIEEQNREFRKFWETENRSLSDPTSVNKNESEKAALRAYLQRAEVRLSTMHRIAGAFLSGAGLLILLPILFKDSMTVIVKSLTQIIGASTGSFSFAGGDLTLSTLAILCFILPCAVVLIIPLCSLWLLLKDLTLFYFTANIPPGHRSEASDNQNNSASLVFHPRIALTGIPFADDESPTIKKRLRELQFNTTLKNFILSQNDKETDWLTKLIATPEGEEIALPRDAWVESTYENSGSKACKDNDALRMSFGLAGAYNRDLVSEVAKTELSLIRHNLSLRRLLMRYMKALLIIIWTATLFFILSYLVEGVSPHVEGQQVVDPEVLRQVLNLMLGGLLVWSLIAPIVVRSPVRWIKQEYDQNKIDKTRDKHLIIFETAVTLVCVILSVYVAACFYLTHSLGPLNIIITILTGSIVIWHVRKMSGPIAFLLAR